MKTDDQPSGSVADRSSSRADANDRFRCEAGIEVVPLSRSLRIARKGGEAVA